MDARKPWTNELCKWTRFESLFRDDSKFLFLESRNSPNSSREYSSIACCYRDRQESEFFLEKYCFANSWWWEFNYPGRKQFRFSQPDERFFSRRDNVESVYIYTVFLPANGESIIHQLFRERKREARDAHRWCGFLERAMPGCSHFKVERRLRLYGAITVVYCKLASRRLPSPFFPHPDSLPSFRKRRGSSSTEFFVSFPVQSKVRCSEQWMEVDIVRSSPRARIYLQQMKDFPGKKIDSFREIRCEIVGRREII